jgi:hypothetical protein
METKELGRKPDWELYEFLLEPGRMQRVNALEKEFHQRMGKTKS